MEQRRDSSEHTYFDEPLLSRIPLNDRSKVHSYERNWTTSLLFASFPVSSYYSRYTCDAN